MTEFTREFCLNDPEVMGKIFQIVKDNHKPAQHTEETLWNNRHTENFCEEARHFSVLGGKSLIFLHYDVTSSLAGDRIKISIDSIGIYDSQAEFVTAKYSQISTKKAITIRT